MIKFLSRTVLLAWVLAPAAATAGPVTLKLAFFTSDQSISYRAAVQPFVDAVNADPRGLIKIETHFSGALGKEIKQQPQLLLDGTADLAYIVPGITPERFPDNGVVEIPGLFRDMRQATTVFTRLIAANTLRGYDDFFVIGAYVTAPETFHSRVPLTSISDLKGKRIRVNNSGEAAALTKLGAMPVVLPINQLTSALGNRSVDAVLINPTPLADYGIKRIASFHFLLETSGAPLVLAMNRKKFENLPPAAQDLIRRHSGMWSAKRFADVYDTADKAVLDELKSDKRRTVTIPSEADMRTAANAYKAVADDWVAANPRNAALLQATRDEIIKSNAGL